MNTSRMILCVGLLAFCASRADDSVVEHGPEDSDRLVVFETKKTVLSVDISPEIVGAVKEKVDEMKALQKQISVARQEAIDFCMKAYDDSDGDEILLGYMLDGLSNSEEPTDKMLDWCRKHDDDMSEHFEKFAKLVDKVNEHKAACAEYWGSVSGDLSIASAEWVWHTFRGAGINVGPPIFGRWARSLDRMPEKSFKRAGRFASIFGADLSKKAPGILGGKHRI